jgi:hypothetical protein
VTLTDRVVFDVLDRLGEADFQAIEPVLLPWVRREHRLLRRDRDIVELAGCYIGRLCTARAIAEAMAKDLRRFRARSAPESGKRALLASISRLNGGKSIGAESIRAVLAGKKSRRQLPSGPAIIPR